MSTRPEWRVLSGVGSDALSQARATLHHAAQIVSLPGRWLLPPRPDDGHTALECLGGRLCGAPIQDWRPALEPAPLCLALLRDGGVEERLALEGRTPAEARLWMKGRLTAAGIDVRTLRDDVPYELPPLPGDGATFAPAASGALEEVARYLFDGDRACRALAAREPGATPVRCWPHHFDVGAVLPVGPGGSIEGSSVGVGLSPGDAGIPEPYFYVNLWPAPDRPVLPELTPGARWHTRGWTGAVLPGSALVAAKDAAEQEDLAARFLTRAVEAARGILAGG